MSATFFLKVSLRERSNALKVMPPNLADPDGYRLFGVCVCVCVSPPPPSPLGFVNFKIIPKPWQRSHMCRGPDGYRRSPLHQDASIGPKDDGSFWHRLKEKNPAAFAAFSLFTILHRLAGGGRRRRRRRREEGGQW